jgi:adhesin/invasin
VLATLVLWLGCEQKGDISPTGSNKRVLTFIDTVIVDPRIVGPGESAAVQARIMSEINEPAESENVRFSVTRGTLPGGRVDTTVLTDRLGWARTSVTAPADTGTILLRTDLLSMSEQWATNIRVSSAASEEGVLTVWSDADTLYADNGFSRTLVHARLRNEAHNPIPGVVISFSTNVGSVTQAGVTDSVEGTAHATLVSTTETGPATVVAYYGSARDTAQVLFLEPVAASLVEVTSSRPQITAGSDSSIITARVFGTNGLPVVDNTLVSFSTTQGTLRNLTARTVSGVATSVLYASPATGVATVTATTGGSVTGNTHVTFMPGPTAAITLSASADTLFADNTSQATVTATVVDAFGNFVAQGTPVSFLALGGTVNGIATVDVNGRASATFRAGLTVGPAAVTATQSAVQASVSIYLQPTSAASITLTADPMRLVANGATQSNLRAAVLDAQSRPVSDGTPVSFYAQRGTISGAVQGAAASRSSGSGWSKARTPVSKLDAHNATAMTRGSHLDASPTASIFTTTTVDGYAYALLTSSTVSGADTLTASAQSLSAAQILIYNAGPAARINVTPAVNALPADGLSSTTITCQVTDAFANPVSGGLPISLTATLGQMVPREGYTDEDGVFVANLFTSRQHGVCAIVATSASATGYSQVTFNVPVVASVNLNSDVTSLLANGVSQAAMTVTALDVYALPVQGASVEWDLGAGSGRLVVVSATTDSLGRAAAIFYSAASRTDLQQQVTASVGGHLGSQTLPMLGITLQAWADALQLPADGNTTTNANVLIRETTSGQAVVSANVRFAASSGSIALTGMTNSSGIASALYRSASQPGNADITAVYGDTLRAQTGVRLTGIEADTVITTLGHQELLADGVSSTSVTAVVFNEGGQAVANTPVTFTVVGAGSCFPPTATTNSIGVVAATYYSAALANDQQVAVDAAIDRDNDEKPILLRGVSVDATASEDSLPANGTSTSEIRIQLRRSSTQVAIPNAAVQLGTSLGTIPAAVTTDSSGVARATFAAGVVAGTADIYVRFGNLLTDTVSLNLFQPSASFVTVAAQQTSLLGSGEAGTLVSTVVLDQRGTPMRNQIVNWSLSGPGALYGSVGVTDANGVASNLFTAPAAVNDVSSGVIAGVGAHADTVAVATRGVTLSLNADAASIPANGAAQTTIRAQLRETATMVAITDASLFFGTSLGSISADLQTDEWGRSGASLQAGRTAGTAMVVCRYGNLHTDTVSVNLYAPAPYRVQLTPGADVLHADGLANTDVRAVVYDAMNVVLQDVPVTWSAPNGQVGNASLNTGTDGWADARITAPASQQDRLIIVTVNSGAAVGVDTILTRGITIDVTATPEMVIADGSSTSLIRVHVYETSSSVAINYGAVTFGSTLGTVPNSATTDASGLASVLLRSTTTTGVATVTASYGNILSDQAAVTLAASTPTTLSLTATPTVLLADNISTSALTAVVTDQSGNPVPNGTQVRFSIPPQSGSLENLRTTQSGVAVNTLTSSSTPDTLQVIAWAEANPTARDSVSIVYRVGAPTVVTLSAQRDTLPANGIAVDTISAHVTDAVGHVLSNVEVRFITTVGNITSSRVTDASGDARVAFSSSQTGTAQVTATAGTATSTYTVYLIPGSPNSISMDYLPNSVGVRGSGRNETLLITATVRDANNNAVLDGTPVYFNINSSPGNGDFLSSTGPIPTINGRATVSYNSGTRSGSVRIRAVCAGISAVSTEILIYAGPPYIEDVNFGCETSHMSLAPAPCSMFGMDVVGDSVRLVVLVGDRYNNPVTPGTAIYFTTSGGVITTATGYTDSLGFARVTLFSGSPLPTTTRWTNTLSDPNLGGPILCTPAPTQPGVAKVLATSAGVDANGDSVTVWATTNVIFDYSQPILHLRSLTVNGDPSERTLYIGQNALITVATYDPDFWPLVSGSTINFSASYGLVYPSRITVGCPGDTLYTVSFFNNRTLTDDDAASPVLITVDTRQGDAYTFTETFTLLASLPPAP